MSAPVQSTPEDLQAESLARDISSDMPSPYCPGRSIASCPSSAARELEDDILDLAKQGMDREAIEVALVSRFGEEKMGASTQSEVLVAILLAAAIALAGLIYASRKWLRSSSPSPATGSASRANGESGASTLAKVSADELDRLEDELDDIDGI